MTQVVKVGSLHAEVAKIVDIDGVSAGTSELGSEQDKKTWKIHYKVEPTKEQLTAVQAVIDNIQFISEEDNNLNIQSRAALQDNDWKVLRFIEKTFMSCKSAEDIFKAVQDKDFQAMLKARQAERDTVKPDYSLDLTK